MKEYKVKALSVGGLNNKIFSSGDIVNEKQFPEGNADKLVDQGFLEPLSNKEKDKREADKKAAEQKAEQERLQAEKLEQERLEKEAADKKAKEDEEAKILAELEKEEADKKAAEQKKK